MKHPTDQQRCQAHCKDREATKAAGFDHWTPCERPAIDVRADFGLHPRLVCGIHARQGAVKWQHGDKYSRFIAESRLSPELLEKVLVLRNRRLEMCREEVAAWQDALQEAETARLRTEEAVRKYRQE